MTEPREGSAEWGEEWLRRRDPAAEAIVDGLREGSPELVDLLMEVLYGKVFQRPTLDPRTKCLLAVACAAAGGMAPQVRYQSRLALLSGVAAEELYDACFFVAAFNGLSHAMNAMNLIRAAVVELEQQKAEPPPPESPA
jgi:4-carboxymuconolactone decarboxylase